MEGRPICSLARKEEKKTQTGLKHFKRYQGFPCFLYFKTVCVLFFSWIYSKKWKKKRKLSSVTTTDTRSAAAFIQTPLSFQGLSLSLYLYIYSQQRILCLSLSILYTWINTDDRHTQRYARLRWIVGGKNLKDEEPKWRRRRKETGI